LFSKKIKKKIKVFKKIEDQHACGQNHLPIHKGLHNTQKGGPLGEKKFGSCETINGEKKTLKKNPYIYLYKGSAAVSLPLAKNKPKPPPLPLAKKTEPESQSFRPLSAVTIFPPFPQTFPFPQESFPFSPPSCLPSLESPTLPQTGEPSRSPSISNRSSLSQLPLHLPRSLHLTTRKKPTINTETSPSAASFFSFGLLNSNLPVAAFLQQHAHRANSRSPSPQICETPTSSSQQGCPSTEDQPTLAYHSNTTSLLSVLVPPRQICHLKKNERTTNREY
jgi:hypothetical protein